MSNAKYKLCTKLPGLLAWALNLGPVVTEADWVDGPVSLRRDGAEFLGSSGTDTECINLTMGLVQLGVEDAFNGAPVFLPRQYPDGNKMFNVAYAPAAVLSFRMNDGNVVSFAFNVETCEDLSHALADVAVALRRWESDKGLQQLGQAVGKVVELSGVNTLDDDPEQSCED